MIIKKSQTTIESFASGKILDYPMPDEKLGISYQEHDGRVSRSRWGINKSCYEVYYVVGGSAEVYIDDEHAVVLEGDLVVVGPGQRSYLIAKGLKLLTITMPNWYPEQYVELD